MNSKLKTAVAIAALMSGSQIAFAGDSFEGAAHDAWLTGRIETAYTLNTHLNPFDIDTDVANGVVDLTGTVESPVERDLAIQIAKGIDGVVEVNSHLQVEAGTRQARNQARTADSKRDFGSWFDDATTTASVKSRLMANENVKGLEIDVDTFDDEVTLSGRVETDQERELAEQIAKNVRDVKTVTNHLVVDPE